MKDTGKKTVEMNGAEYERKRRVIESAVRRGLRSVSGALAPLGWEDMAVGEVMDELISTAMPELNAIANMRRRR